MKTYLLIIDSRAIDDIQRAFEYYNEIYGDLGEKFENAVKASIAQIQQNPFYQVKYKDIRSLPLKKFPYSFHYTIDEKYGEVHVLALIHTASDPDKTWMWQEE